MKRILLFVCVALLAWACSKDEDNTPPSFIDINGLSAYKIIGATSDTAGLKLYGYGYVFTKDSMLACGLGAKYGKLWCGFFSSKDLLWNRIKEEFVYVGNEDLSYSLEYEIGYGETSSVVFIIDSVVYESDRYYSVGGCFFNEEEFAISTSGSQGDGHVSDFATIFVNGNDVVYKHLFLDRLWYDGYYVGTSWTNGVGYQYSIFDLNGDVVYDMEDRLSGEVIPISLYDYVSTSNSDNVITVERVRLPAGTIVWSQTLSVGETINGNAPRVTYSRSLEGKCLHIEATAVNYDGSKETKSFKIDIETGEMEK